ncbi:hypothetical protein [Rugosimonospora africana]|nr:hypothetical protein [Rugosimonospora africana]
MPDAFTTLWTHDTCRALRQAGRVGMRPPVAFSGVHSSLPSWASVAAGDDVYAGRNRRGVTRGLRHVVDGRLERAVSLHGVYRLTVESADALANLLVDAPDQSPATSNR